MNNTTFEVFVAMEYELRKHIHQGGTQDLDKITSEVRDNEDLQFLWSIVSAEWEEESAAELLQMIVNHWVRIRGFSYASAWLEKYDCPEDHHSKVEGNQKAPDIKAIESWKIQGHPQFRFR